MVSQTADVLQFVRSLIGGAFQQPLDEYRRELEAATRLTGIDFKRAMIRPVFLNGSPTDVEPQKYLLFVGLNPKLDVKRPANTAHYAELNRDAESNERYSLGYFHNIAGLHQYFKQRAVVVRAFCEAMGSASQLDDRELLRKTALFAELVPYHSEGSAGDLGSIAHLPNVMRSRRLLREIVDRYPPAAVILDGNATHGCLADVIHGEQTRALAARTQRGECRVRLALVRSIPVVKCGFIASQSGVNSTAQRREFGQIIAEHVAASVLSQASRSA